MSALISRPPPAATAAATNPLANVPPRARPPGPTAIVAATSATVASVRRASFCPPSPSPAARTDTRTTRPGRGRTRGHEPGGTSASPIVTDSAAGSGVSPSPAMISATVAPAGISVTAGAAASGWRSVRTETGPASR